MGILSRGVRNAFRNGIRTFSIVVILGLSVGLALAMLLARHAVQAKIDSVQSSIGNIITVSPAGVRGFAGGGEPLTTDQIAKVKALPHVVGVTETLQDRLAAEDTNLQSALDLGSLGRRFNGQNGQNPQAGPNGFANPNAANPNGGNPNRTFAAPIIAIGTNDPSSLAALGGGQVSLTSGKLFAPDSNDNVALIGDGLATKNNLTVGGTFQAHGTDVTVAGIFTSGTRFTDSAVVMPLSTLQRLSGQAGAVTGATVQVDTITNLEPTVAAIKTTLGDAADVVSQQDTSQQALAPLKNIKSVSLFSLLGAVVAGGVIIFLTMLMIVRERRREIAVLKAIGAPNRKVTLQFIYEAVTFTLMGAALGLVGGVLAGNPVTHMLVSSNTNNAASAAPGAAGGGGAGPGAALRRGGGAGIRALQNRGAFNIGTIHAAAGWNVLGYGLGVALLIAVIGTAIPSLLIGRVRPAEVLRGE
ncbi:MAG TPA: FtsX-like permease family protein [Acidimicrobiales bacterium]|jgi:putative ABC transport system permease protein|nr:FtsX-like permease family protein [Acidimicrobiales bacterium]